MQAVGGDRPALHWGTQRAHRRLRCPMSRTSDARAGDRSFQRSWARWFPRRSSIIPARWCRRPDGACPCRFAGNRHPDGLHADHRSAKVNRPVCPCRFAGKQHRRRARAAIPPLRHWLGDVARSHCSTNSPARSVSL